MRIGLQAWGSEGDISPFTALAAGLAAKGHEVTLAVTDNIGRDYAPLAERFGYRLIAVAVSGVVAALSLAVALTVMVASFRQSVTDWLDVLLPADLYLRTSNSTTAGDTAFLEPRLVEGLGMEAVLVTLDRDGMALVRADGRLASGA